VTPTLNRAHSFLLAQDGTTWFATSVEITHLSPPEGFATLFPQPSVFVSGLTLGQGAPILADAVGPVQRNSEVVAHIGSLQFDRRSDRQL
jgi:hypothetical protein